MTWEAKMLTRRGAGGFGSFGAPGIRGRRGAGTPADYRAKSATRNLLREIYWAISTAPSVTGPCTSTV